MTTEQRLMDLTLAVAADIKGMGLKIGDITALKTTAKSNLVVAINELFDRPSGGGGATIDDASTANDKVFSAFKVLALVSAVTADLGDKTTLTTTVKTSLVAAVNELKTSITALGTPATINDAATSSSSVWSSNKVVAQIAAESQSATDKVAALRTELTAGAAAALDTFAELAAALGNDPNFATTLATQMSKRVRFDAEQTLTTAEKLQACTNLGIGNPDVDLLAAYNAAKA